MLNANIKLESGHCRKEIKMNNESKWIGLSNSACDRIIVLYFRRKFYITDDDVSLLVKVSADSRYKLYINENLVSIGPCKGNENTWYYETIDLSQYLIKGENTIATEVVHFPDYLLGSYEQKGPFSVSRTPKAAFWLEGFLQNAKKGLIENISSNEKWRCIQENGLEFLPPVSAYLSGGFEHVKFKQMIFGWKNNLYDDSHWMSAEVISNSFLGNHCANSYGELTSWNLMSRPIPHLYRKDKYFNMVTKTNFSSNELDELIQGKKALSFSPGKMYCLELTADELTTGYLKMSFEGGRDSTIKIIYSEAYETFIDGKEVKGIRDDSNGILNGNFDLLEPNGLAINYETFWFRTFRYIRFEICTGSDTLTINNLNYIETGYPLEVIGEYESSDETHKKLWDISLRTLLRCMHETYEDCPYYEQLQYAMDSRLEMLFTYQLSLDDKLARKCINDFHSSLLPNGLLQSRFPSLVKQIIPGFCLQYIFMLEDHLMYFGDLDFIKQYRPTIDSILSWFDRNIQQQGLVDKTGYWSFVDWVGGWEMSSVPNANKVGPTTIYNLMYAKALQSAAFINKVTDRIGMSEEYLNRSNQIIKAVKTYCYDENTQLFKDGPEVEEYSQHCQVWAVLCDAVTGESAKELMLNTLNCDIAKVSYAMSFYLFRALEKTGLYDKVQQLLDTWRHLADLNLTTWVEDPVSQRSDCHAWGSVPLYEFHSMNLGVKPLGVGYSKIQIKPFVGDLQYVKGVVMTNKGKVFVEWNVTGNIFAIHIVSPDKVEKEIILPDESRHCFTDTNILLKCDLINT